MASAAAAPASPTPTIVAPRMCRASSIGCCPEKRNGMRRSPTGRSGAGMGWVGACGRRARWTGRSTTWCTSTASTWAAMRSCSSPTGTGTCSAGTWPGARPAPHGRT
ncbi:IS3509a transposase [Bifidobacterium pseudolongum subsp. globosum]|nr:IS3509a transposase [Bifidobacterium pseudolongum subsp. globosum]